MLGVRPVPIIASVLLAGLAYRYRGSSVALETTESPQQQVPITGQATSSGTWSRHIVAIGDLHGDLANAKRVLKFTGVIDDEGNWANQVDAFVQTGDIIDRGDDTIQLFELMEQLREQATAQGAIMLSMLGNHEVMNAIGDWRYVYPSEIDTFGGVTARQKFISTGPIGRAWANNYTITARLPLHPSLGPPNTPYPPEDGVAQTPLSHAAISFVHGGLSPTYADLTPFPSRINEIGASLLSKLQHREQPPPHPPNQYPGLPSDSTNEEHRLYDSNGPLWYRGWALSDEKEACARVDDVLERTGTRRMIMGHTPDFTGIVARCSGKIIIIDTGISHAYGGVLSALSIKYSLTPIPSSGDDDQQHWTEREVVTAVYEDKQEVITEGEREVVGNFNLF